MFDFVFQCLSLYSKTFAVYWIYPILALALAASIPYIIRYFFKR